MVPAAHRRQVRRVFAAAVPSRTRDDCCLSFVPRCAAKRALALALQPHLLRSTAANVAAQVMGVLCSKAYSPPGAGLQL